MYCKWRTHHWKPNYSTDLLGIPLVRLGTHNDYTSMQRDQLPITHVFNDTSGAMAMKVNNPPYFVSQQAFDYKFCVHSTDDEAHIPTLVINSTDFSGWKHKTLTVHVRSFSLHFGVKLCLSLCL